MLYNERDEYTLSEICERLGLPKVQAVPFLQPIVKSALLKLSSGDSDVNENSPDDAKLTLNTAFQRQVFSFVFQPKHFFSKKLKVDLTKILMRSEVKKDSEEVQKSVDEDRRMVIQVCLTIIYSNFFVV